MKWNDLAALLVGVATCLPPILRWVYRAASRPRVRVIPGAALDVGYTALGPIVRMTAVFTAERKDAIVDFLTLRLRHERGREVRLNWARLGDPPEATGDLDAESSAMASARPAVAIKLKAAAAVEKRIELHDPEFSSRVRRLEAAAQEQLESRRLANGETARRILTTEALAALIEHCRSGLPWEAGTYSVELEVHVLESHPHRHALGRIRISGLEREQLRRNVALIGQYYQDRLESPARAAREPDWAWLHPALEGVAR